MELQIYNPEPMFLRLDDLISDDLSCLLKQLVDTFGLDTDYTGNDSCKELRLNMEGASSGAGLAQDARCAKAIGALNKIIYPLQNLISELFPNTACDFITGHNGFWIMRYDVGGQFEKHVDYSTDDDRSSTPAVYTLCVRLNEGFEGGRITLSDSEIDVAPGTGVVWDGWTYHEVEPVTKGSRYMLVVHFVGQLKD
jgi:hypothetical protein